MSKMMTTKDIYSKYIDLQRDRGEAWNQLRAAYEVEEVQKATEKLVWCENEIKKFEAMMWKEV